MYESFKISSEIIDVKIYTIGNVCKTILVTFSDLVNRYAKGKTKITNLNNEIINGLKAYFIDCKIPCIETEILININPILDILELHVQLKL